jgi:hypothetical protein
MNTPWWGAALIGGLFALGGVFVSQTVTIRLERIRTKREDTRQWHADRRQIYAAFVGLGISILRLIEQDLGEGVASWPELDKYSHDFILKGQEVMLIGSKPVRDAADQLRDTFDDMLLAIEENRAPARKEVVERIQIAGDEFISAARKELGTE